MAEIERTALWQEVSTIISQDTSTSIYYHWLCEVKANDEIQRPLKITGIDFVRDYAGAYADEIYLEIAIGAGTFSHLIYPYKEDLEITLFKVPLLADTLENSSDEETMSFTFRAQLVDTGSAVMENNTRYGSNAMAGDLIDILYVKFQLLDPLLEQIRMQTAGGLFKDSTPGDVLRYVLTESSKQIEIDDENKVQGVDMVDPNNTTAQKHIVIPHGTKLVEIPDFLQSQCSGIYNAGMGFYLQKYNWYVYPLFDTLRFDNTLKNLTLINVPNNRMPDIELTYRTTANQVIAIVTGSTLHKDDSEQLQANQGNGVRFLDARKVMDGFAETKNNRTQVLRAANNNEFVLEQRKTGLNNVQNAPIRITSNNFVELSRLARRKGSLMQCEWQSSNPDLIYPGMPVKFMYLVEGEVQETTGIVIGAHHYIHTYGKGPTSKRYMNTSVLSLFLDRKIDWSTVTADEEKNA